EHQAEAFQGGHAEQRLVALLSEDHWRRTPMAVELKVGIPDFPPDLRAVGKREGHGAVRAKTQLAQRLGGGEAVNCAGIHQKLNRNFPPRASAGPHGDELGSQSHTLNIYLSGAAAAN